MATLKDELDARTTIFNVVDDLGGAFLYFDRKASESLGVGDIERHIKAGVVTEREIVDRFAAILKRSVEDQA